MKQKAAVFCHNGLGDGIISLILSNNLHQNGWEVDTYHNGMQNMQSYFPHLPLLKYPSIKDISEILNRYEYFLVIHNDTHDFIHELIEKGKEQDSKKIKVIYAYPNKRVVFNTYYEDSCIDPMISVAENFQKFCKEILRLAKTTKNNGFIAPRNISLKKHIKRVILHVSSSRPGKNWPIEKFAAFAQKIKKKGFDPVIVAGSKEDAKPYKWMEKKGFILPEFESLGQLTDYIYESGYFVGNDSGLGHLASCMGIPTVTISRRKMVARFWRPNWAPGKIVVPSSLVPNISGFRLRDRKWKWFISVSKVYKAFRTLCSS